MAIMIRSLPRNRADPSRADDKTLRHGRRSGAGALARADEGATATRILFASFAGESWDCWVQPNG